MTQLQHVCLLSTSLPSFHLQIVRELIWTFLFLFWKWTDDCSWNCNERWKWALKKSTWWVTNIKAIITESQHHMHEMHKCIPCISIYININISADCWRPPGGESPICWINKKFLNVIITHPSSKNSDDSRQ